MRCHLPFALLALVAQPALAQTPVVHSNAELMANDHYTRSHDYDLIHQRIVVSGFNWDSTSFTGVVTTTLVSRRPGLDSRDPRRGRTAAEHQGDGGRTDAHPYRAARRHACRLRREAARLRRHARVHRGLRRQVDNGRGLTFISPDGSPHRPRQIWSQGEDHGQPLLVSDLRLPERQGIVGTRRHRRQGRRGRVQWPPGVGRAARGPCTP